MDVTLWLILGMVVLWAGIVWVLLAVNERNRRIRLLQRRAPPTSYTRFQRGTWIDKPRVDPFQ